MSIGGTVTLSDVDRVAIERSAKRWRQNVEPAIAVAESLRSDLLSAIDQEVIDPNGAVATLVRQRAERFLGS